MDKREKWKVIATPAAPMGHAPREQVLRKFSAPAGVVPPTGVLFKEFDFFVLLTY